MSKIGSLLKEEILRLARKEVRGEVRAVKRASAQHRREIAALKRQVRTLTSRLAHQEKRALKESRVAPAGESAPPLRFSAKGLRSHRNRVGLSAADYAKLAGVTQLSIYNWERGVARPRQESLAVLASLRALNKTQARARLSTAARQPTRKRARKRRRS